MYVSANSKFIDSRSGISEKTRNAWYSAKFIDEEADVFFTCFIDKDTFDTLASCPKYTPVKLYLTLTPGKKSGSGYFRIESIAVIE